MTDPSGYQYGATEPSEMQQKMDEYHRREALINMSCDYNEHDELVEIVRNVLKNKLLDRYPQYVSDLEEVIKELDHYDIELQELNKKVK